MATPAPTPATTISQSPAMICKNTIVDSFTNSTQTPINRSPKENNTLTNSPITSGSNTTLDRTTRRRHKPLHALIPAKEHKKMGETGREKAASEAAMQRRKGRECSKRGVGTHRSGEREAGMCDEDDGAAAAQHTKHTTQHTVQNPKPATTTYHLRYCAVLMG